MNMTQLETIAEQLDTPSYVFDEGALEERISLIRDILPKKTPLCFAVKANPFLISVMEPMVDRLEVCSPGEYEICIREQVPPDKIVVSGVNKTYESMKRIFSYSKGAGIYTIESERHYEILSHLAAEWNTKISVLLRLSSGNQFGMDSDTLMRVAHAVSEDANMELTGIHYYAGTQKKSEKVKKELNTLAAFAERFRDETGMSLPELEYGPGLKVSYFENDGKKDIEESNAEVQLSMLAETLGSMSGFSSVTIEMGRFLVSECGYYLTQIEDIKRTGDTGYIIVDGGIHQLNYYGWMMGMKRPYIRQIGQKEQSGTENWNLCGSLCTVNDVLAREVPLVSPEIGDKLLFARCGAYAATEGMAMFLCRDLPQILLLRRDGKVEKLRGKVETNEFISMKL